MKGKIFIIAVLILSSILASAKESYSAQASVSASVIIILPPREEDLEKVVETSFKEDKTSWEKREITPVKDKWKD